MGRFCEPGGLSRRAAVAVAVFHSWSAGHAGATAVGSGRLEVPALLVAAAEPLPIPGETSARSDIRSDDVPAPSLFDASATVEWDGRRTMKGVWIAHPAARSGRRVRIYNLDNGAVIDGALFRSEARGDRPSVVLSSDGAKGLGLEPKGRARLRIVAVRPAGAANSTAAGKAGTTVAKSVGTAEPGTTEVRAPTAPVPQRKLNEDAAAGSPSDAVAAVPPPEAEKSPSLTEDNSGTDGNDGGPVATTRSSARKDAETPATAFRFEPSADGNRFDAAFFAARSEATATSPLPAPRRQAIVDPAPAPTPPTNADAGPVEAGKAKTVETAAIIPAPGNVADPVATATENPAAGARGADAVKGGGSLLLGKAENDTGILPLSGDTVVAADPAVAEEETPALLSVILDALSGDPEPSRTEGDEASAAPADAATSRGPKSMIIRQPVFASGKFEDRVFRLPSGEKAKQSAATTEDKTARLALAVPDERVPAPKKRARRTEFPAGTDAKAIERPYIQVGLFGVTANAERLVLRLQDRGIPAGSREDGRGEKKLHRVIAGPFATLETRDAALAVLRELGVDDATPVRK